MPIVRYFRKEPPQRRRVYHVLPKGNGWSVRAEGSVRASGSFASMSEALAQGRKLAGGHPGGRLMIHSPDGRVETDGLAGPVTGGSRR